MKYIMIGKTKLNFIIITIITIVLFIQFEYVYIV